VTDPSGREWEIYVSKVEPSDWKPGEYSTQGNRNRPVRPSFLFGLLALPAFLWNQVIWPPLRFLVLLPSRAAMSARSSVVRVEAVLWWPRRESYLWTTSIDHVESVVAEVAAGLEAGSIARPFAAKFVGSSS
jgi:hypothetical protein